MNGYLAMTIAGIIAKANFDSIFIFILSGPPLSQTKIGRSETIFNIFHVTERNNINLFDNDQILNNPRDPLPSTRALILKRSTSRCLRSNLAQLRCRIVISYP